MSASGQFFIEQEDEIKKSDYILDTRPQGARILDWLKRPQNHMKVMIAYMVLALVLAPLWPFVFLLIFMHNLLFKSAAYYAPFRYPKHVKAKDPSLLNPATERWEDSNGVYFLGWERSRFPWKKGREIWLTMDDCGVHKSLWGTTGSGKSVFLLSVECGNALNWGSGYLLADGKADNKLIVDSWAQCRAYGRDADYLLVSYLTGGYDPFINNAKSPKRRSNKANMFGEAPLDFLSELLTSMLPKTEGDGATWQQKAVNMMKAVTRICCFLRADEKVEVSVKTLRDFMALPRLIKIYRHAEQNPNLYPESAIDAVKSYLMTGISWSPSKTKTEDVWKSDILDEVTPFKEVISNETQTQHGYLTNQFLAPLSMLADTYGHIFKDPFPEADVGDVMLRRRCLIIAIPTLEKSPAEASNLGRLLIGAMRLMMGRNLGDEAEGTYRELIKNKATNAKTRFTVILDEAGYYFAPGLDVIFAQSRSLYMACTIAGQDIHAMKKEGKDEIYSVIGNNKIKLCMPLEEPKETFEVIQKVIGEATIAKTSGSEVTGTMFTTGRWERNTGSSVETVQRVTFEEVKGMKSGEGVASFLDKTVRYKSYYAFAHINPDGNVTYKLNKFLQVQKTKFTEIEHLCEDPSEKQSPQAKFKKSVAVIAHQIRSRVRIEYEDCQNTVFSDLKHTAQSLDSLQESDGFLRGACLFERACLSFEETESFDFEEEGGQNSPTNKPQSEAVDLLHTLLGLGPAEAPSPKSSSVNDAGAATVQSRGVNPAATETNALRQARIKEAQGKTTTWSTATAEVIANSATSVSSTINDLSKHAEQAVKSKMSEGVKDSGLVAGGWLASAVRSEEFQSALRDSSLFAKATGIDQVLESTEGYASDFYEKSIQHAQATKDDYDPGMIQADPLLNEVPELTLDPEAKGLVRRIERVTQSGENMMDLDEVTDRITSGVSIIGKVATREHLVNVAKNIKELNPEDLSVSDLFDQMLARVETSSKEDRLG